ncbi:MAG: HEPN domain-containing protein [Deltaproteobacteria bacterium]|nr:HEPN domain-containing protein [Deltaproteobacteria bacterium]
MTNEEKIILIRYRLERTEESLKAASLMLENNLYIPAINRIYYSMFYAIQALLVLTESSFSKHCQVKGYFNREFIKKGVFPKEFGKLFNAVFEYRQKFDYVDLIIPERDLVSDYIIQAKRFNDKITKYLEEKLATLSGPE